jgi:hypothetical protein
MDSLINTELFQILISIAIGLGLAAACGFRVFLPLFLISLMSHLDFLHLAGTFEWMSSWPALIAFGSATLLEIGAYYVPFIDNLLDTVATPAAILAGALAMMTQVGDQNPLLAYSFAAVAGAGAAGGVQAMTTLTRQFSSVATAGFGNPIVATAEAGLSVALSMAAIFIPLLALAAVLGGLYFGARTLFGRQAAPPAAPLAPMS